MDVGQLKELVIIPTLEFIGLNSESAVNLLIGTAAQESAMGEYLKQKGTGPALGIYQMEPVTFADIYERNLMLHHNKELREKIDQLKFRGMSYYYNLAGNLYFATALCRLKYRLIPEKLPKADDIEGLANYWKEYYNTPKGKGTVGEFVQNYNQYVPCRTI